MTQELLPCPFCGGDGYYLFFPRDERHGYVGLHEIRCTVCPASVYASDPQDKNGWATGSGEKAAITAWNTRASFAGIENPAAFVQAARGMMEALERIATVDMGGGFLGAQACRQVAGEALTAFRAATGEQA